MLNEDDLKNLEAVLMHDKKLYDKIIKMDNRIKERG